MIRYKSNNNITYFCSSTGDDNNISVSEVSSTNGGKKRVCIKYLNSTTSYGLTTDTTASEYSPKIRYNNSTYYFGRLNSLTTLTTTVTGNNYDQIIVYNDNSTMAAGNVRVTNRVPNTMTYNSTVLSTNQYFGYNNSTFTNFDQYFSTTDYYETLPFLAIIASNKNGAQLTQYTSLTDNSNYWNGCDRDGRYSIANSKILYHYSGKAYIAEAYAFSGVNFTGSSTNIGYGNVNYYRFNSLALNYEAYAASASSMVYTTSTSGYHLGTFHFSNLSTNMYITNRYRGFTDTYSMRTNQILFISESNARGLINITDLPNVIDYSFIPGTNTYYSNTTSRSVSNARYYYTSWYFLIREMSLVLHKKYYYQTKNISINLTTTATSNYNRIYSFQTNCSLDILGTKPNLFNKITKTSYKIECKLISGGATASTSYYYTSKTNVLDSTASSYGNTQYTTNSDINYGLAQLFTYRSYTTTNYCSNFAERLDADAKTTNYDNIKDRITISNNISYYYNTSINNGTYILTSTTIPNNSSTFTLDKYGNIDRGYKSIWFGKVASRSETVVYDFLNDRSISYNLTSPHAYVYPDNKLSYSLTSDSEFKLETSYSSTESFTTYYSETYTNYQNKTFSRTYNSTSGRSINFSISIFATNSTTFSTHETEYASIFGGLENVFFNTSEYLGMYNYSNFITYTINPNINV